MFRAFKQGAIRCGIRKCTLIVFLCDKINDRKKALARSKFTI